MELARIGTLSESLHPVLSGLWYMEVKIGGCQIFGIFALMSVYSSQVTDHLGENGSCTSATATILEYNVLFPLACSTSMYVCMYVHIIVH